MRKTEQGRFLQVRAIGGLHVVTLTWNLASDAEDQRADLLGFAIERTELKDGQEVERYFLRGIKRFKDKDQGLPPGTPVPTSEHPVQSFQWGDYTVKPATTYRYRVVPVVGQPKLLDLAEDKSTSVEISTEAESEPTGRGQDTRHEIYFNRGVAGSQAYARKFSGPPDEHDPTSEQMKWLSRGLFEALVNFIGLAAGNDAADYKLRAMLYEFRYAPVGKAFKIASDRGADVAIRYEAQSYKSENEAMIRAAGIKSLCKPQRSRAGIRHNKFIVLIHKDVPVAVWTGSTNISAGGIFGHSNVGHVIWNQEIAQRYVAFWDALADPDVKASDVKAANLEVEPTPDPDEAPPENRILTLFSPRDGKDAATTLEWYADLMRSTKRVMCMTFAFNLDAVFQDVLASRSDVLRYAVFDKTLNEDVEQLIHRSGSTVIAAGAILKKNDLEFFLGERLTGFNRNRYIHDKFILIDPLGDDPVVVTGTANFSKPSQSTNDENMLVIRGNTRVADIYFGEFMRVFDHLYARYVVAKLRDTDKADPDAGYLKDTPAKWQRAHFTPGPKERRRRFFMGE